MSSKQKWLKNKDSKEHTTHQTARVTTTMYALQLLMPCIQAAIMQLLGMDIK